MRIKKEEKVRNNTKIAILFVLFIVGVFLISFALKGILILNQSKYDNQDRFIIRVSNGKDAKFLSMSSQERKMSVLRLKGDTRGLDVEKYLAIPLDGYLEGNLFDAAKNPTVIMWDALVNYGKINTDLTIVDIFRILMYVRGIPDANISQESVTASSSILEVDRAISSYTKDSRVEDEKKSIQIINGTEVAGLGNRLARVIANMGGEVILVSTSDNQKKESEIFYTGKKSYTIKKLSNILNFKSTKINNESIADITVVIGEDFLSKESF